MKGFKFPKESDFPKHIMFGKAKYKLSFSKTLKCYGITDPDKQTIVIKAGLSPRELLSTVIHELLHVLELEKPSLKMSHDRVYLLERAFMDLLLDNWVIK